MDRPPDYASLVEAAQAQGWILGSGSSYGGPIVYTALRFDGPATIAARRTFTEPAAVRAWLAAGCPAVARIIQLSYLEVAA